ncbi:hypothetical protein CVD28_03150 [Bacillus sp. M6-12]|uniref:hypothetical protein n=1 Tax=Bacillus sp. M6-12 TaxID=2054166 RepID=UPI000C783309|nr:hypothetical protein [Bacillus sp. M6-12]PLS19427.1 hypothetical protein CVD28_03150 [Bacillus sp. M6-12]
MSALDDAYEGMMIENYMISEAIDKYVKIYSPQQVVNDAISSFREESVDEEDSIEAFSKEILKTIARIKRVSDKQKRCLIKMLVLRGEDGYEYGY